jgi:choline dehydrogenase-like flavoprotein
MSNNHYDVIIIGTGAGGGTLAHRLAPSGKKILLLERGTFLPREKENWNTVGNRSHSPPSSNEKSRVSAVLQGGE